MATKGQPKQTKPGAPKKLSASEHQHIGQVRTRLTELRSTFEEAALRYRREAREHHEEREERRLIGRKQSADRVVSHLRYLVEEVTDGALLEQLKAAVAEFAGELPDARKRAEHPHHYGLNELGGWQMEGSIAQHEEMLALIRALLEPAEKPAGKSKPDATTAIQQQALPW